MKTVFKKPAYLLLSTLTAFLILALSIWLPNLSFVKNVLLSEDFLYSQKINILIISLGALKTNFTPASRTLTIVSALLSGINFSLLIFYFKRLKNAKIFGSGLGGTISTVLGSGCASCGSVILTSLFGVTTTVSLIYTLPLRGNEFSLAGITILVLSIFLLTKKINKPISCQS